MLQVIVSGLTSGAIYALIALSYNIIFGASGVLNFAQGALLMTGSVTGAMLIGDRGWPVLAALVVATAVGAFLGALEEIVAVRPATSKGAAAIGWVVATLGFAIVVQAAFALLFGADARAFPAIIDDSSKRFAGAVFNNQQVMLWVVALLVGLGLHVFYRRTRIGWALTAIAHDREAAAMRGIPVDRLALAAFAAGGGLAAMTGFLAGPLIGASPSLGFTYALSGFVAAAAGGIPDVRGAVAGGFALGLMEAIGVDIFGAGYRDVVVFGVLIVVLMVRPHGFFGRGAVRTV